MNHLNFAALGLLFVGLITTGVISWFTLRQMSNSLERQNAIRWIAAFGLSICTFMSATPLVGQDQLWFLILPFAGIGLSLDSLHRMVEDCRMKTSKHSSNAIHDGTAG